MFKHRRGPKHARISDKPPALHMRGTGAVPHLQLLRTLRVAHEARMQSAEPVKIEGARRVSCLQPRKVRGPHLVQHGEQRRETRSEVIYLRTEARPHYKEPR